VAILLCERERDPYIVPERWGDGNLLHGGKSSDSLFVMELGRIFEEMSVSGGDFRIDAETFGHLSTNG